MRILIDINHPAHVHYFRALIGRLERRGYQFIVTCRDEKLIKYLLRCYDISFISRNSRPKKASRMGSIFYLLKASFLTYKIARGSKIDLVVGFGSSIGALTSFLINKPMINLDDTEHNTLNHLIYSPFSDAIITPVYFKKQLRTDQIRVKSFIEQLYLNKTFEPKESAMMDKTFALCRFIAYDAGHDSAIDTENITEFRKSLVELLRSMFDTVCISCEDDFTAELFREYKVEFDPVDIHSVISKSSIFISEGATMACEAGLLGVPFVYMNPLRVSNIDLLDESFEWANQLSYPELISRLKGGWAPVSKPAQLDDFFESNDFLNINDFLEWFICNFPKSHSLTKGRIVGEDEFLSLSVE